MAMAADFWSGRPVLVTGAGGFVGSWLTRALVDAGAAVTALVRDKPAEDILDLLGAAEHVSTISGSVTDQSLVERVLNEYEIDTCFHLAAQAIVGAANRSPVSTFDSNIRGTWSVLEACRASPLISRVVVASSDKAYGTQTDLPYREDQPLLATNPYDVSKACADILARSYHQAFSLPIVVTRCANIFGGGDLNFSRLIPGTIRSTLEGERPVIRSDGSPLRDYIHVDDAVSAYLVLAERARDDDVCGRAFNFGADQPISVLNLAQLILSTVGRPDITPDIQGSGKLSAEIDRQYLDSSLARQTLGWETTQTLETGLGATIDWYRDYFERPGRSEMGNHAQ